MSRRVEALSDAAAGAIAALHEACFPDDPWDQSAIAQIMRMPGFFGRVGWEGNVASGFGLALDLGREAEILSLGVVPGARRRGMGSALLTALFHEAGLRAADSIVLEVAVTNSAARALYAASGFIVVGHRRNYYRMRGGFVDGLILRRAVVTARRNS